MTLCPGTGPAKLVGAPCSRRRPKPATSAATVSFTGTVGGWAAACRGSGLVRVDRLNEAPAQACQSLLAD